MTDLSTIIAVAALFAIGAVLIVVWFTPATPSLTHAMSRMEPGELTAIEQETAATRSSLTASQQRKAAVGHRTHDLVTGLSFVTIPTADLAVLGRPTAVFIGDKVLSAGLGFLLPIVVNLLLEVTGDGVPWTMPAVASFILAILLFFSPDREVRSKAEMARVDFRRALGIYIDIVAMISKSGVGGTQALEQAALVGDSWVVRRIDEALQEAARAGKRPWNALKKLSAQIELKDLADLADIMTLGSEQGTQVTDSLQAKARSLRNAMTSESAGSASSKTQKLGAPLALLVVLFLFMLAIPAVATLAIA